MTSMLDGYSSTGGAKRRTKSKSPKTKAKSPRSKSKPKRKLSSYAKFVKKFAADNKGLKGPQLMKNAGAKWRSMSDAEKKKF